MNYLQSPGFHLQLLVCPGDFVTEETVIAEIRPAHMTDVDCVRAIHDHISIFLKMEERQDLLTTMITALAALDTPATTL